MKKAHYASRVEALLHSITHHLPKETSADEKHFATQFYHKVSLSELELMTAEKAAAIVHHTFDFFCDHVAGTTSIRIFTPNQKEHGYESHHIIVQIVNEDRPFLVDSLTNEINALGFIIHAAFHPVFHVDRDPDDGLKKLYADGEKGGRRESLIHYELSGLPEDMSIDNLKARLNNILEYVYLATQDWRTMLDKAVEARDTIAKTTHYNTQDINETQEFLDWLMHKNYVFLGYVSVDFNGNEADPKPVIDQRRLLGISKIDDVPSEVNVSPQLVDVRKAGRYAKVHRHVLMDVVTVKRINNDGNVIGEHRFYGLFTSTAYYQSTDSIPLVQRKIRHLLRSAGFPSYSHNGKTLVAILQFMPRDELFQISEDDLFDLSMGVLALETRPGVKLFARMDIARRYISTLVYVPRELFSTDVRKLITQTLEQHFCATQENYEISIGESTLARLHIVFRTSEDTPDILDIHRIENEIATAIMLWSDRLKEALRNHHDEQQAERLFRTYAHAFGTAYTSRYPVKSTLYDIHKMETCLEDKNLQVELFHERDEDTHFIHLKIYNMGDHIPLSDILPTLEHMGLRVIDEFPYVVQPTGQPSVRMRDIRMQLEHASDFSLAQIKPNVEALLLGVWSQHIEDDVFNALVFSCGLNIQQIEMLRACCKYLRQIAFTYGKQTIGETLTTHPELTLLLVQLFEVRFDPSEKDRDGKMALINGQIEQGLSHVESLKEDRIISTLQQLIMSMLRTNYYIQKQADASGLSFKLDSSNVPNIPLPKPFVEIFVYSAQFEGIHLRGGKVARGGLRWSDRPDDFRTEILGLMKAQMVKNAVIVPVGSKGGFVVKQADMTDREAFRNTGIECYKRYLRGMLDITDNVTDGNIIPPPQVVRHDGDDPYLVVAADKGTATFSDIANGISAEYQFWLDDAFASGGSQGYDHKEMGITARGAWVSVERHFSEMGLDTHTTPFTVVGIGDMSGDVFGNGMLLSEHIQLVAAFNHLHIFVDPTPDPVKSFAERKRLFELPRSSWTGYDRSLISKGGGIFERSAKQIKLNAAIRNALGTDVTACSPDELIQIILKAPVDLLWNGGIGTYVKASHETHEDAGDHANNHVRIDASELRARVVGEGGNLGLTQQGRIEYAKTGGRINTDAIDNSAGVDCSDHEVNIKITLQQALSDKRISLNKRNTLLKSMTDEVATLVLRDNQLQTQAISIEQQFAAKRLPSHIQLIRSLERRGLLDRTIEFLPDEAQLTELRERGQGLSRPEISVLLAYSKLALFTDIMDSSMPDEPYFAVDLLRYFPRAMEGSFGDEIKKHSLKREIIGTVATNSMVNRAGVAFYFDILEDTSLPTRDIVAAYSLARDIFRMRDLWGEIEQLDTHISATLCAGFYNEISQLLKFATYWLLRHRSLPLDVDHIMDEFCANTKEAMAQLSSMLNEAQLAPIDGRKQTFVSDGITDTLATTLARLPVLNGVLDICSIAYRHQQSPKSVGTIYFAIAETLRFFEIIEKSSDILTPSRWDRSALQSLIHGLYDELARLVDHVFAYHHHQLDDFTSTHNEAFERVQHVVDDILSRDHLSSPMLMVALQQLKQIDPREA